MSIAAHNWAIAQRLQATQKLVLPTGADFQPVSAIVAPLIHRIAAAAIKRAELQGNPAKAERMRAMLREFLETRNAS